MSPALFAILIIIIMLATPLLLMLLRNHQRKRKAEPSPAIGAIGFAETDLTPQGLVLFGTAAWSVIAANPLPRGSRVQVIAVEGVLLRVAPLDQNH